ncbi:MAG: hypothetical protein NVSMB24_38930 [Mucilaginibacter sp.]
MFSNITDKSKFEGVLDVMGPYTSGKIEGYFMRTKTNIVILCNKARIITKELKTRPMGAPIECIDHFTGCD